MSSIDLKLREPMLLLKKGQHNGPPNRLFRFGNDVPSSHAKWGQTDGGAETAFSKCLCLVSTVELPVKTTFEARPCLSADAKKRDCLLGLRIPITSEKQMDGIGDKRQSSSAKVCFSYAKQCKN